MAECNRRGNGGLSGDFGPGYRRTIWRVFPLFLGGLLSLASQGLSAQEACCEVKVPAGPAAQWEPSPSLLNKMRKSCGPKLDTPGSRCLLEWMTQDNATYEAMVFSRSIGVRGYLRHYRQEGLVGVAYVVFPGEKTDRYGIFIVNGDPFRFDPDDTGLPLPAGLQGHPRYLSLAKQHWSLTLLPGERSDLEEPMVMPGLQDGQRFLFTYHLSASKGEERLLDTVQVWVDFDASGKFIGRELESLTSVEALIF